LEYVRASGFVHNHGTECSREEGIDVPRIPK
jgi:hypothetical protein